MLACALLSFVSAAGFSVEGLRAQVAGKVQTAAPRVPTIASMSQALLQQDYTSVQLRRFRTAQGQIVTVRERLQVQANGTKEPLFAITFLGVEGEPAGSPLYVEWQQAYARYGNLFFRHGSFHVRDLVRASANYTLHDFGPVVRAGRSARRIVVFPASIDKAIWVLDIDSATHVPVFVAEFDSTLKVFAEIEAQSFSPSVVNITPTPPMQAITPVLDFAAAQTFLGNPTGLVDPDIAGLMGDYELDAVEVHQDPLNGREKVVMSYTDGIDQFMVVQTVNVSDPFTGLPGSAANVIGRFRDPAMSALVFWDDDVSFHIAGRGALSRLDDVARKVYRQALSQ